MTHLPEPEPGPDSDLTRLALSDGSDPETLRREVSLFRLALDADLTVAAAAVEGDAMSIASQVLDDERRALHAFSERLLSQLSGSAVSALPGPADAPAGGDGSSPPRRGGRPIRRHRSRISERRLSATARRTAAVAVAATLVGGAGGMALAAQHASPARQVATPSATQNPASAGAVVVAVAAQQQLATMQGQALAAAARAGLSSAQISAASAAFSTSIGPLLVQAPKDAGIARALLELLDGEEAALRSSDTADPAIAAALQTTEEMLRQLRATVSAEVLLVPATPASASPARPTDAASPAPTTPEPARSSTATPRPSASSAASSPSGSNEPGPTILPLPSASNGSAVAGLVGQ